MTGDWLISDISRFFILIGISMNYLALSLDVIVWKCCTDFFGLELWNIEKSQYYDWNGPSQWSWCKKRQNSSLSVMLSLLKRFLLGTLQFYDSRCLSRTPILQVPRQSAAVSERRGTVGVGTDRARDFCKHWGKLLRFWKLPFVCSAFLVTQEHFWKLTMSCQLRQWKNDDPKGLSCKNCHRLKKTVWTRHIFL